MKKSIKILLSILIGLAFLSTASGQGISTPNYWDTFTIGVQKYLKPKPQYILQASSSSPAPDLDFRNNPVGLWNQSNWYSSLNTFVNTLKNIPSGIAGLDSNSKIATTTIPISTTTGNIISITNGGIYASSTAPVATNSFKDDNTILVAGTGSNGVDNVALPSGNYLYTDGSFLDWNIWVSRDASGQGATQLWVGQDSTQVKYRSVDTGTTFGNFISVSGGTGGLSYLYNKVSPWPTPNSGGGVVTNTTPDPTSGRISQSNWTGIPTSYSTQGTASTQTINTLLWSATTSSMVGNNKILPNIPFNTDFTGQLSITTNFPNNSALFARVTFTTIHYPGTPQQITTNRYASISAVNYGDFESLPLSVFSSQAVLAPNPNTPDGSYDATNLPISIYIKVEFFNLQTSSQNITILPVPIADNTVASMILWSPQLQFTQYGVATQGTNPVTTVTGGTGINVSPTAGNVVVNLLPPTASVIGGVKAGNNITIATDGTISSTGGGSSTTTNSLTASTSNNIITSNVNGVTSTTSAQIASVYTKNNPTTAYNLSYSQTGTSFAKTTRNLAVVGGIVSTKNTYIQNITATQNSNILTITGTLPATVIVGNWIELNNNFLFQIRSVSGQNVTISSNFTNTTQTYTNFEILSGQLSTTATGVTSLLTYQTAQAQAIADAFANLGAYQTTFTTPASQATRIATQYTSAGGTPRSLLGELYVVDVTPALAGADANYLLYNQNQLTPPTWAYSNTWDSNFQTNLLDPEILRLQAVGSVTANSPAFNNQNTTQEYLPTLSNGVLNIPPNSIFIRKASGFSITSGAFQTNSLIIPNGTPAQFATGTVISWLDQGSLQYFLITGNSGTGATFRVNLNTTPSYGQTGAQIYNMSIQRTLELGANLTNNNGIVNTTSSSTIPLTVTVSQANNETTVAPLDTDDIGIGSKSVPNVVKISTGLVQNAYQMQITTSNFIRGYFLPTSQSFALANNSEITFRSEPRVPGTTEVIKSASFLATGAEGSAYNSLQDIWVDSNGDLWAIVGNGTINWILVRMTFSVSQIDPVGYTRTTAFNILSPNGAYYGNFDDIEMIFNSANNYTLRFVGSTASFPGDSKYIMQVPVTTTGTAVNLNPNSVSVWMNLNNAPAWTGILAGGLALDGTVQYMYNNGNSLYRSVDNNPANLELVYAIPATKSIAGVFIKGDNIYMISSDGFFYQGSKTTKVFIVFSPTKINPTISIPNAYAVGFDTLTNNPFFIFYGTVGAIANDNFFIDIATENNVSVKNGLFSLINASILDNTGSKGSIGQVYGVDSTGNQAFIPAPSLTTKVAFNLRANTNISSTDTLLPLSTTTLSSGSLPVGASIDSLGRLVLALDLKVSTLNWSMIWSTNAPAGVARATYLKNMSTGARYNHSDDPGNTADFQISNPIDVEDQTLPAGTYGFYAWQSSGTATITTSNILGKTKMVIEYYK